MNSCSDEGDSGPKIGFASTASTVVEGSKVSVKFSVPLPEGVTPKFSFGGTAKENMDYFYQVSADRTELTVRTAADNSFDDDTVEIELTGFRGDASPGEIVKHTLSITDPSLFVKLNWVASGTDMNLVLWRVNTAGTEIFYEKSTELANGEHEEYLTIPASATDAVYGLTYHYYSGSATTLRFSVTFSTTAGSIDGSMKKRTFFGTYTSVNKNPTFTVGVEQFLIKEGFNYHTFSDIIIPNEGSRSKSSHTYTYTYMNGLRTPL